MDFDSLRRRYLTDATFHWHCDQFVRWLAAGYATRSDLRAALVWTEVLFPNGEHMNDRMLQFFKYDHLPPHLRDVSRQFAELANAIVATLPQNAERTVALRKLLESKDCAVRAVLEGAG